MKRLIRHAYLKKLLTPLLALALIEVGSCIFDNNEAHANTTDHVAVTCADNSQTVAAGFTYSWGVSAYASENGTFTANATMYILIPDDIPIPARVAGGVQVGAGWALGFQSAGAGSNSDIETCTQLFSQLGSQTTSAGDIPVTSGTQKCANYTVNPPPASGLGPYDQQCGSMPATEDTAPAE